MAPKKTHAELSAMPNRHQVTWEGVEVVGLVKTPLALHEEDPSQFDRASAIMDFKCYDGWIAPNQRWEGVPVSAVLEQAGADPDAKYVNFVCGEFIRAYTLSQATAADTLLVDHLNGRPLAQENGGPCRLLAGSRMGPSHVKWVARIEVTNEKPES